MNEINNFLKKHKFETNPNIESITNILLEDMKNGLSKDAENISSMDMIPIWKNITTKSPKNKSVITIDAGGTNFRTALVQFSNEGKAEIHSFLKYKMPALDYPMTNDQFFDKLAEYLRPLKNKAEYISFCFSFAIKIYPDGSGEAIKLSKEIKLPELSGKKINEELLKALEREGWTSIKKIVMVNDTACVLQAGAINEHSENFTGFIGFVLGTGLNSAYIENEKIEKLFNSEDKFKEINKELIPEAQIIVCESGKCKKIPQSDFDKELSQKSKLADEYFLERMCSGRYLGELCSIILRTAGHEELFTEDTNKKITSSKDFTTEEISTFLTENKELIKNNQTTVFTDYTYEDCKKIYALCNAVFKRAGILSAGILASAAIKMCNSKSKKNTQNKSHQLVCISADGSVFLKGFSIKETIEMQLNKYLREEKNIDYVIKTVETPVSLGASFFVLD